MDDKKMKAYNSGRAKALQEIEARFAAKLNGDESHPLHAAQRIANSKPRTPHEKLGLGFGNREQEHARVQLALENATKAGRILNRYTPPSGGQPVARTSDGLFIPTPRDIADAMERNKEARAELQKITVQNRQAQLRRLGFNNVRREHLLEKLAAALEDKDSRLSGPVWSKNDDE